MHALACVSVCVRVHVCGFMFVCARGGVYTCIHARTDVCRSERARLCVCVREREGGGGGKRECHLFVYLGSFLQFDTPVMIQTDLSVRSFIH